MPQKTGLRESVFAPFLQALITGFFTFILATAVSALIGIPISPFLVGLIIGSIAALFSWGSYRSYWGWFSERAFGIELETIREVPEEKPQAKIVRLEIVQDHGSHTTYLDMPLSLEEMIILIEGLHSRPTFTYRDWVSSGKLPERIYVKVKETMLGRGFLEKSGQSIHSGYRLTPMGEGAIAAAYQHRLPRWKEAQARKILGEGWNYLDTHNPHKK